MAKRRSQLPQWIRKAASFGVAVILVWFAGTKDLPEVLIGYVFPEADSFGAAQVSLVPFLPASVTASRLDAEAVQLLILKHNKRESQEVTVLTRSPSVTPEPLLVGSIGRDPLPRPAQGGLPPSRVLLDASLPDGSVIVVGAPAITSPKGVDEEGYSYRTSLVVGDVKGESTLVFSTVNEQRETRLLYWMGILLAVGVCLTAGRFRLVPSTGENQRARTTSKQRVRTDRRHDLPAKRPKAPRMSSSQWTTGVVQWKAVVNEGEQRSLQRPRLRGDLHPWRTRRPLPDLDPPEALPPAALVTTNVASGRATDPVERACLSAEAGGPCGNRGPFASL